MTVMFETALDTTLGNEGGWSNNPHDSGGETYKGIARNFHPDWIGWGVIDAVKKIGLDYRSAGANLRSIMDSVLEADNQLQRMVHDFYVDKGYWNTLYEQLVSQSMATKIFDMSVVAGVGTTVRILQQTLGVTIDGIFGSQTLAALNSGSLSQCGIILEQFKWAMAMHFVDIALANPKDLEFLKGWLNRTKL